MPSGLLPTAAIMPMTAAMMIIRKIILFHGNFLSANGSFFVSFEPSVTRSSYTSSNGTVHRSTHGNDGHGHSFSYSGSYKKY